MNNLSTEKQAQILSMLVEGISTRSTTRFTGVSINTVIKILNDAGHACAVCQDHHVPGIPGHRRVEYYEKWKFMERKNLNMRMAKRRFTRLTTAFRNLVDKYRAMISLYFVYYNFCRIHKTMCVSLAMEIGLDHTVCDCEWIIWPTDARASTPNRPKTNRMRNSNRDPTGTSNRLPDRLPFMSFNLRPTPPPVREP